jgi:hypothetical protein
LKKERIYARHPEKIGETEGRGFAEEKRNAVPMS